MKNGHTVLRFLAQGSMAVVCVAFLVASVASAPKPAKPKPKPRPKAAAPAAAPKRPAGANFGRAINLPRATYAGSREILDAAALYVLYELNYIEKTADEGLSPKTPPRLS